VLRSFAEKMMAKMQEAVRSKPVTKHGAVNSSGNLADSFEIKMTSTGFQILANHYIYYLLYGRKNGKAPPISAIRSWIEEKGIQSELPIDSLAFLIARKIAKKGTTIYQTYGGSNSGLLEDAMGEDDIDGLVDELGDSVQMLISSQIMDIFETSGLAVQ